MRSILAILTAATLLVGCRDLDAVDTAAPAAPRGIRTVSLDNAVDITWLANTESDVAGYNVWWSDRYDGRYELLGTTKGTAFTDTRAVNGVTTYYALSAFDFSHNESSLSHDVIYDTPRPEGYDVVLGNALTDPLSAGYDFSTYTTGNYSDQYTDVFFESSSGLNTLNVWTDSDIQDMGYTSSLDEISAAPTQGWAPSKTAEAIVGHTYVIWTWDDHYAKVRVTSVSTTGVRFDWAYQTATANVELRAVRPVPQRRSPLQRTDHVR